MSPVAVIEGKPEQMGATPKFTSLVSAESDSNMTPLALTPLVFSLCLTLNWWQQALQPFRKPSGNEGLAFSLREGPSLKIPL